MVFTKDHNMDIYCEPYNPFSKELKNVMSRNLFRFKGHLKIQLRNMFDMCCESFPFTIISFFFRHVTVANFHISINSIHFYGSAHFSNKRGNFQIFNINHYQLKIFTFPEALQSCLKVNLDKP